MNIIKRKEGRNELAKLFFGRGAELGVERGKFSEVIMRTADMMYAIDLWKNYGTYRQHVSDSEYLEIFEDCKRRLAGKNVEFMQMSTVEAAQLIPNNSLDWVYIDAAHNYESVRIDLGEYFFKVRPGGIIGGHDITGKEGTEVRKAVYTFCNENKIPELVEWCGDKSHSYSFIKPVGEKIQAFTGIRPRYITI